MRPNAPLEEIMGLLPDETAKENARTMLLYLRGQDVTESRDIVAIVVPLVILLLRRYVLLDDAKMVAEEMLAFTVNALAHGVEANDDTLRVDDAYEMTTLSRSFIHHHQHLLEAR